jgi:hypothetical protein
VFGIEIEACARCGGTLRLIDIGRTQGVGNGRYHSTLAMGMVQTSTAPQRGRSEQLLRPGMGHTSWRHRIARLQSG